MEKKKISYFYEENFKCDNAYSVQCRTTPTQGKLPLSSLNTPFHIVHHSTFIITFFHMVQCPSGEKTPGQ